MVCPLRNAVQKIMGKDKSYLHYYKRIIKDYERGNCNFDIRILIKELSNDRAYFQHRYQHYEWPLKNGFENDHMLHGSKDMEQIVL